MVAFTATACFKDVLTIIVLLGFYTNQVYIYIYTDNF